jgi:hypothetical protein
MSDAFGGELCWRLDRAALPLSGRIVSRGRIHRVLVQFLHSLARNNAITVMSIVEISRKRSQ